MAGIRQLQQMLLKIALVLGVEFHVNVEFVKLVEPTEDQENEGEAGDPSSTLSVILYTSCQMFGHSYCI